MNKKLEMLKAVKPNVLVLPDEVPVRHSFINHVHGSIPIVACHNFQDINTWASANRPEVNTIYEQHGVVLFRGFNVATTEAFYNFSRLFTNELIEYTESSTPRTKVADKVYTSTEYPSEQFIPMHNEHSYSSHWPGKVWFHCVEAATKGGQTPLADSRKVLQNISIATRKKFEAKGVMYVRNFSGQVDLHWKDVFQTSVKSEVEAYCEKHGLRYEWVKDGLRTVRVGQALHTHPVTGEEVWFNQAHLFHITGLPEEAAAYLMDYYGKENLPRNTYYGDGTEIEEEVLAEIREAYDRSMITFDWQPGDIVMVDNVLYAHGRFPFEGKRRVLVAMAEPYFTKTKI